MSQGNWKEVSYWDNLLVLCWPLCRNILVYCTYISSMFLSGILQSTIFQFLPIPVTPLPVLPPTQWLYALLGWQCWILAKGCVCRHACPSWNKSSICSVNHSSLTSMAFALQLPHGHLLVLLPWRIPPTSQHYSSIWQKLKTGGWPFKCFQCQLSKALANTANGKRLWKMYSRKSRRTDSPSLLYKMTCFRTRSLIDVGFSNRMTTYISC